MPIWTTLTLFFGAAMVIVVVLFGTAVVQTLRSSKRGGVASLSAAAAFVAREWLHAGLPRIVRSNWEVDHGVRVDERPLLDVMRGKCTERHAMHLMGITSIKDFRAQLRDMKARLHSHVE